jgi:hypothetical protein
MMRISKAQGIIREVLEKNHQNATVKVAESGESDFRVGSVGASISVHAYGENEMTEADISEIKERASEEIDGRHLEYRDETSQAGTRDGWFELSA